MTATEEMVLEQLTFMLSLRGNECVLPKGELLDYAKIGSFLSDEAACRVYLAKLSEALVGPLKEAGMIVDREDAKEGESKLAVKTTKQVKTAGKFLKKTQYYEDVIVKHNKVLTKYFAEWEAKAGFNAGYQREGDRLPPRPATLTDFVHADDFRNHLLKHAYHWKDAGVGVRHGEFTHRIQWWMIVEKNRASKDEWLENQPVDLFKGLAESKTINGLYKFSVTVPKVSVWDQIVDNSANNHGLKADDKTPCPHAGTANGFREPERLHAFVQDNRFTPDLWALGFLIWGRKNKRSNETAKKIRERYQEYIEKNQKVLVRRGFLTGENAVSSGTIIWKET